MKFCVQSTDRGPECTSKRTCLSRKVQPVKFKEVLRETWNATEFWWGHHERRPLFENPL